MSISKIFAIFLVLSFILLYEINFNISVLAQVETTIENTASTEAVTSVNDAILKSLLIISQVAVLGITFNYFFFSRFLNKKRDNSYNFYEFKQQNVYFYSKIMKRVSSIVILCSISIAVFSTCIMLLQSFQLSQTMDLDIYSAFDILFTTSVGQVWLLRIVTSSTITATIVIFYFVFRMRERAISQINSDKYTKNKIPSFRNNKLDQIFLLVIIALSSINLFSNSMVSHSNSLSSLSTFAVSMDWIHFMAVSIWLGGLFYLSLIFLKNTKPIEYNDNSHSSNAISEFSNNLMNVHSISISLMNFSFVVIIALCGLGISGLYLGYVHLQNLNSLVDTVYGQILILKLGLAFPLIFVGRYNQLKIYKYASLISNILKDIDKNIRDDYPLQQYLEKRATLSIALNRSLKIESLLALSVLVVASFLSVTSPPSLEAMDQGSSTIQNTYMSESNNSFFLCLVITLAVIIFIIGIVNFRKNQKQIKSILDLMSSN